MYYGSPFYIIMIILLLGVCASLRFFIGKLSLEGQKAVVFLIMLINAIQHLFKWAIYPIYEGQGFSALSTAYNVCAFLILLMPIAFVSKSDFLRDFVFLAGAFAGLVTNLVPYWHIGIPVSSLGWEYARFYICHSLLFYSGMLPLLLGMHKLSYRRAPLIGLGFILSVCLIMVNNVVCISLNIYGSFSVENLYEALYEINPAMSMRPIESLPFLSKIASYTTPSLFLPSGQTGRYTPILWYAIPTFLGFSFLAFLTIVLINPKELVSDLKRAKVVLFGK